MKDVVLVTDIARLMQVFARLEEGGGFRVRIANSLDAGGEEIAREKPAAVFVQSRISGLSAEILLMHLKKQLGRKRTRFILLASPDEAGGDAARQYQEVVDTSQGDDAMLAAIRASMGTSKPTGTQTGEAVPPVTLPVRQVPPAAQNRETTPQSPATAIINALETPAAAPSLEEQGITYAPRVRPRIHSEFTNSFEDAVTGLSAPPPSFEIEPHTAAQEWDTPPAETIETTPPRSKLRTFILWSAPVLVAALAATLLQHGAPRGDKPATTLTEQPEKRALQNLTTTRKAPLQPAAAMPAAAPRSPAESDARMSDKAVISAIAENRPREAAAPAMPPAPARPSELPPFITRASLDKQYSAANPGWERYSQRETEYRVLREPDRSIRAVQVIDRTGEGVSEWLLKQVLRKMVKKTAGTVESRERSDGYEIQRGMLGEGIRIVYYRDEKGKTLRAFVVTWP